MRAFVFQSLGCLWTFSFPTKVKGLAVPASLVHDGWSHEWVSVCAGGPGEGVQIAGPITDLPIEETAFLFRKAFLPLVWSACSYSKHESSRRN